MTDTPKVSPRVTNAAAQPRRWRDVGLMIGLLLLVLIGLIGLAAATGWQDTLVAFRTLGWAEISILLALSLVNYVCRGLRWHMFAQRLGLPLRLLQALRHFLGGFAMSVTPGRVGELVRMRWIRRETGWPFDRTAPLVLVDRAADLAAMAILLGLALSLSMTGVTGGIPVVILAIGASIVVTRPVLLHGLADMGHRLTRGIFPRFFVRVRRASRSLAAFSNPAVIAGAGLLGFVGWFAEGYAFHILLVWLGADIGLWKAVAIFIFSTLAGGLTGAPGGLGGAEAAMIALLSLEGVPLDVSVPATLVIRFTTLWFAILIGFLIFPWAEKTSQKAKHALENT